MSEWKEVVLGDVTEKGMYGYTESANFENVGPRFLRITDIQNGFVNWHTVPYCPISEKDKAKYLLKENDIVIARTGNSTGENYIFENNVEAVFASYLIRFRVLNTLAYPKYVWYNMRTTRWNAFINGFKSGSAQEGANANILREFPFLLPELAEQKEIAKTLSLIDKKITLLRQQNQDLEELAQTLFKRWFVEFEFPVCLNHDSPDCEDLLDLKNQKNNQGNQENPKNQGSDNYATYKSSGGLMVESELGEIPEGWRVGTLEQVAKLIAGGDKPQNASEIQTEEYNVPIYSNGIKDDGLYGYTDKARIFEESITVSARGTIGFVSLKNIPYVPIVRLISVIPIQSLMTAKYLYLWLKKHPITGTGTTQQQLTVPEFRDFEVLVPNSETLTNFTNVIDSFYNKKESNTKEIQTLTQLRDTLLPKLMSGEIRLNHDYKD